MIKLKCVEDSKDKALLANETYDIHDYYYLQNELLVENSKGYFLWYPCRLFNYNNIDELLKDVNN